MKIIPKFSSNHKKLRKAATTFERDFRTRNKIPYLCKLIETVFWCIYYYTIGNLYNDKTSICVYTLILIELK